MAVKSNRPQRNSTGRITFCARKARPKQTRSSPPSGSLVDEVENLSIHKTYSATAADLTVSNGDSGVVLGDESIEDTAGVDSGVGVSTWIRALTTNGTLCGSGDISIESIPGPGEDDGSGGVLTFSIIL